ncbi:HAD family hydrolase [Sanguibacter antarcticus]|uniref:2-haloacid dehalogenase n=1 Tax=Sanguibacter antarcticus TaxID=372484 RepID=A0A2A9E3H1_9MICO|nr:HAD family phosphatase [Sanguibacter antarcticus]PFG33121.1 2-haloacid dehalogenase [Sanguibacter antarcticus]
MSLCRTIDAVLFDLGNVLVGWDPCAAFDGVLTRAEVEAFFTDIDFVERNRSADAGTPWEEVRASVAAAHPQHAGLLDRYVERFSSTLTGPVPGTSEIVDELVGLEVPVFGLTNWSAELFHLAQPAAPVIGLLRGVVVSGEEWMAKPDPAIFELTVRRFGLDPARTVFVDDAEANVRAADSLGFQTVHFTDASALRVRLVDLGVVPALDDGGGSSAS